MMADPIEELAELERQDLEGEAAGEGDTQPENPDTDQQLIAGKYRSVEEAVQATEHAQQMIGRQAQELGELRSQMEQLQAAQYQQQPEPQYEDQGAYVNPLFNVDPQQREQINESFLNDPLSAMATILDLERQMNEQRFAGIIEERIKPLAELGGETQAERVFNALKHQFGDEKFLEYRDHVAQRIKEDPSFFQVKSQVAVTRLANEIKAAEYEKLTTQKQPTPRPRDEDTGRFVQGAVHTEGGSTPAPQQATQTDDVDPEIAEIRASGPKQDIFGFVYAKDANNS